MFLRLSSAISSPVKLSQWCNSKHVFPIPFENNRGTSPNSPTEFFLRQLLIYRRCHSYPLRFYLLHALPKTKGPHAAGLGVLQPFGFSSVPVYGEETLVGASDPFHREPRVVLKLFAFTFSCPSPVYAVS